MSENQNQSPGLYYVIPSQVFEDERLDHPEIVFYALLSGLATRDGYCFASNANLAERMKRGTEQIERYLKKLEDLGYIRRDTKRNGILWERKIFIEHNFNKNSRTLANEDSKPPQGGKEASAIPPIVSKDIESKERVEERETRARTPGLSSPPERVTYGKFVKLSKEEFDSLRDHCGGTNVLSDLIAEINDYLSATGKKPYADYAAAIRNWNRRNLKEGKKWNQKKSQTISSDYNPTSSDKGTLERHSAQLVSVVDMLKK
jgi:DNA-binding Lrp family transcriptional regulator